MIGSLVKPGQDSKDCKENYTEEHWVPEIGLGGAEIKPKRKTEATVSTVQQFKQNHLIARGDKIQH